MYYFLTSFICKLAKCNKYYLYILLSSVIIFMTIVTSSKMLHIQFSLFFICSFFANLVIRCHSNSLYFGFDTGFVHLFWLIPNRSKKMFHLYTFYVLKFKELLLMHLNNPRSTFSIFKSSWFPYSGWYSNDKIFSMCSLCSSLSMAKHCKERAHGLSNHNDFSNFNLS